jgi:uncharacterized oligopeptide transporter (OPT) family protein
MIDDDDYDAIVVAAYVFAYILIILIYGISTTMLVSINNPDAGIQCAFSICFRSQCP